MEALSPHLTKVKEINCAISRRRNQFIAQYQHGHMGSKALLYEPALDREVYKVLKTYEQDDKNAYIHVRNNLNGYTQQQLETFIGERVNAGLSTFRYNIRDGVLYPQGMDDSLIDMIKRGRDCRDAVVRDVDKPRQDAEVTQFERIQEEFTKTDALGNLPPIGKTIVSISPPGGEGSAYGKNFYDAFVLEEDPKTKERFVAAHRYASDLSEKDYKNRIDGIDSSYLADYKGGSLANYFLSHPLVIPVGAELSGNPEKIHEYFHKGHDFLSTEDFQEVKRKIAGLIVSYVNTLCETPDNKNLLDLTLNAMMNKADHVADTLRRSHITGTRHLHDTKDTKNHMNPASLREITELGNQKVRIASSGCGDSSGFGQDREASNMSLTSSADFGSDNFGSRTFNCPECGEMNIRPVNQTIGQCQHCGSEKVAC